MKINVIRCKNIHSLKGEHIIHFDKPPLSEAGLFAITGPTGAGKSTILDVITLALFNKIPRFTETGKENVSKNEIEKAGSVMTHFTDQAYAEIDYEANGKAYRSKWEISKNKNGNLNDYKMELATLPDKIPMDLKKSQVPQKNEEILNLTYDQFIRSILLSQGQFAKFLKSDEKERAKLLENLTGTEIYRKIGSTVYAKMQAEAKVTEMLQRDISSFQLLSEEEIEAIKVASKQKSELSKELTDRVELLNRQLQKQETLQKIQNDFATTKQDLALVEKESIDFEPFRNKMNIHEQLQVVAGQLALWKGDHERLGNTRDAIQEEEKQVILAQQKVNEGIIQVSQLTHQTATEDNYTTLLWDFKEKLAALDNNLGNLKEKGRSVANSIDQLLLQEEDPVVNQIRNCRTKEDQQAEAKQLLDGIMLDPHFEGLSKQELDDKTERLQNEAPGLFSQVEVAGQLESLKIEIQNNTKTISSLKNQIEVLKNTFHQHNLDVEKASLKCKELKDKKEKLLQTANLQTYRSLLKEEEPCPLCGSLEHPYSEKEFSSEYGKVALLFDQSEKEFLLLQEQKSAIERELLVHQTKLTGSEEQKFILAEKVNLIMRQWPDLPTLEVAEKNYQNITIKLESIKRERRLRGLQNFLQQLMQQLTDVLALKSQVQQLTAEKKQLFAGEDAGRYIHTLQEELNTKLNEVKFLVESIKQKQDQLKRIEKQLNILVDELAPSLQKLGFSDPKTAIANILPEQEYRELKWKIDYINERKIGFQKRLETLQEQQDDMNAELKLSVGSAEEWKEELISAKKNLDQANQEFGAMQKEIQKNEEQLLLFKDKQKALEIRHRQLAPLVALNNLIGDSTGHTFAKFAQNLSLQHLISQANKRLVKLTDRYVLLHTDIEQDLRISDAYQGGVGRSVKTLSGGETFLVSLALALSLSDLASNQVKLESLFIDEGFGTLDQESLETALSTLEKLQSESNRTIGIISHVESLKERITTKIQVVKNTNGYSSLVIE